MFLNFSPSQEMVRLKPLVIDIVSITGMKSILQIPKGFNLGTNVI
jgi:hypothetical protein